MDAVERNGYELIPHPAYSPDLAPSNFFLFPNLKKDIRGPYFRSDEEVVMAVGLNIFYCIIQVQQSNKFDIQTI